MSKNGSTVNAVASHRDESGCRKAHLRYTEKDLKPVRQQNQKLPSKPSLWFSLFVVFTLIGFVIGTVYITHLQKHLQHLEEREQALEARVKALEMRSPCEDRKPKNLNEHSKALKEFGLKNSAKIRLRRVRHLRQSRPVEEFIEESPHINSQHHSIGSHNIALIFADSDKLAAPGNGGVDNRTFHEANHIETKCKGVWWQLMVNKRNDTYWCKKMSNSLGLVDNMLFTEENQNFYYFSRASWMDYSLAKKNYKITNEGRIRVKNEGIYIIHASVHFISLSSRYDRELSYSVYKREGGSNSQLIGKCTITPLKRKPKDGPDVYPCQVWQLQHLKPDDEVFMEIGRFSWFRMEKETFHLALIKLTGDPLVA